MRPYLSPCLLIYRYVFLYLFIFVCGKTVEYCKVKHGLPPIYISKLFSAENSCLTSLQINGWSFSFGPCYPKNYELPKAGLLRLSVFLVLRLLNEFISGKSAYRESLTDT